jgi:hypothetical protein
MKKFKTQICANSNCDESFDIKNYKKKFCCLPCKNQANYKYHQEVYSWEVKMLKARNKNIQILEYYWKNKMFIIQEEDLMKFGFDFMAGYMYISDDEGTSIFRFGNIGLKLLSNNQAELFEYKNDEL